MQLLPPQTTLRGLVWLPLVLAVHCTATLPPATELAAIEAAEPNTDAAVEAVGVARPTPQFDADAADSERSAADTAPETGPRVQPDGDTDLLESAPEIAPSPADASAAPETPSGQDIVISPDLPDATTGDIQPGDLSGQDAGAEAADSAEPADSAATADQAAEAGSLDADATADLGMDAAPGVGKDTEADLAAAAAVDVAVDNVAPEDAPDAEAEPDAEMGPTPEVGATPADAGNAGLPPPPKLMVLAAAGFVACDDGNPCTTDDRLLGGTCMGVWKACGDGKPCTVDSCQPATGNCAFLPSVGPCDDGNACTIADYCDKAAACTPGKLTDCDDGLPCSVDSCHPKTGCAHKFAETGSACGTGAWCLPNGACVLKLPCMGMPALCDDGQPCTMDWCDTQGGCIHMPADDNDHCDDGDPCTPMPTDKCKSGKCTNVKNVCACQNDADCVQMDDGDLCNGIQACLPAVDGSLRCQPKPASAVVCATLPPISCKVAACDPGTGQCLAMAMQDGVWCDDGDACSVHSACLSGACKGVQALQCATSAGCGAAACNSAAGCQNPGGCGCANCDDGDPCTVDDCAGSACSHKPVQCPALGPCLASACAAAAGGGYQCVATALQSVAPLAVPVPCSPFAVVAACDAGYACKAPQDNPALGWCTPLAQVACDDGLACTVGDVCDNGACRAGYAADCDDDNPCTADACGASGCASTPIQHCKVCVEQDFETEAWKPQWAAWSEVPEMLKWTVGKGPSGNGRATIAWTGGTMGSEDGSFAGYLFLRRLYADTGTPALLDFKYRASFGYSKCGLDDLEVVVNGQVLWRACASTPGGLNGAWQKVKIDLGVVAGGGFDVEFRAIGASSSQGQGAIEVDKVRVAGACDTACLAAFLDPAGDARDVPSSPIPHGFKLTSSAPGYAMWAPTSTGGQLGPNAMTVKYAGTPPGQVVATATWRVPQVRPVVGSVLQFWARALLVGNPACGADDLVVAVAGVPVVQICGTQPQWKNIKVELSAWAGQTVDVTVSAVSGTAAASSGVYQIDGLTVTGGCSYACMLAQFESPTDVAGWWKGNTAGAPQWALQSDAAAGGDGSMGVDLGPDLAVGAVSAIVPAMQWRWPMPVAGATLEVQTKVTADTATCPLPIFRVRFAYTNEGVPPSEPKLASTSETMLDVLQTCQPSTDFVQNAVEVGDPIRGRKFVPVFVLKKPMLASTVGIRIDEFVLRCR